MLAEWQQMPKRQEENGCMRRQTEAGYINDEPPNGGLRRSRSSWHYGLKYQQVCVEASIKRAESQKKKRQQGLEV